MKAGTRGYTRNTKAGRRLNEVEFLASMNRTLHIARVESELGALAGSEAIEMLRAGFLSPTDLYRIEGTVEWKPLSELSPEPEAKSAFTLKLAQERLGAAQGSVVSGAELLTRSLKRVATLGRVQLTESASRMLDSHQPQIQKLVAVQLFNRSVTRTQAALRDDEFMRKVFGATYDCLPKPICRFVTEEAFIQFCMERRGELLGPQDGGESPQKK